MAIGKEFKDPEPKDKELKSGRIPIENPSQSIRRDALTEDEVWLMCCIALSEEDTDLDVQLLILKNLSKYVKNTLMEE